MPQTRSTPPMPNTLSSLNLTPRGLALAALATATLAGTAVVAALGSWALALLPALGAVALGIGNADRRGHRLQRGADAHRLLGIGGRQCGGRASLPQQRRAGPAGDHGAQRRQQR